MCVYNILKNLRQNLDSMPGIGILYRETCVHGSFLCAGFGLAKLATGDSMRCSDVSGAGALRRCELGKGDQHTGRNLGGFERTFGGFERVSWVR